MKPTADNPPEATPYAPGAPFTSEKTTRIFIPAILMHFGAAAGSLLRHSSPVLLPLLPTDGSGVYYVMLALAEAISTCFLPCTSAMS